MLRNHYSVDMGASGLILPAESKREILADKVVAVALRRFLPPEDAALIEHPEFPHVLSSQMKELEWAVLIRS